MGVKRYELDEAQWARISPLLPGKMGDPGRSGSDNRLFVNGCLWVLRSGAPWCDLPERYGRWKTLHRRFSRWCQDQALGRSRGGLTTKIHMLADTFGRPLRFCVTPGQASDIAAAPDLLSGQTGGAVLADKAYDGND